MSPFGPLELGLGISELLLHAAEPWNILENLPRAQLLPRAAATHSSRMFFITIGPRRLQTCALDPILFCTFRLSIHVFPRATYTKDSVSERTAPYRVKPTYTGVVQEGHLRRQVPAQHTRGRATAYSTHAWLKLSASHTFKPGSLAPGSAHVRFARFPFPTRWALRMPARPPKQSSNNAIVRP
ncbi:hypothetical protein PSPO01_09110 [Paraphaeosphaeria sporulosa]